jgi:hypothetical protein
MRRPQRSAPAFCRRFSGCRAPLTIAETLRRCEGVSPQPARPRRGIARAPTAGLADNSAVRRARTPSIAGTPGRHGSTTPKSSTAARSKPSWATRHTRAAIEGPARSRCQSPHASRRCPSTPPGARQEHHPRRCQAQGQSSATPMTICPGGNMIEAGRARCGPSPRSPAITPMARAGGLPSGLENMFEASTPSGMRPPKGWCACRKARLRRRSPRCPRPSRR